MSNLCMRTLDGVEVRFDEESCDYGVFKNGRFTGEEFNLFGLCTTADKLTLNACRMWYNFLESGKWALHEIKTLERMYS